MIFFENKQNMFYKIINEKSISLILLLFALSTIIITLWTLGLGMTMRDEGWYLYLIKDQPLEPIPTRFFEFFDGVFNGSIYAVRLSVFFVDVISVLIFSGGLYTYYKEKLYLDIYSLISLISLSILGIYLGHITVNYVFSYIILNREIVLSSLGLLMFSLNRKNKYSTIIMILSGYLIGNLIFIMITNTIYIILVLFFLFLEKKYQFAIKWYILGIILSIIVFFLFFQPFDSYILTLKQNIDKTINNKYLTNHGIKYLFSWIIETIKYLVYNVYTYILVIFGLLYLKNTKNKYLLYLLYFVGFCCSGIYIWENIFMPTNKVASMVPFIALMFFVLYKVIEKKGLSIFILFTLLIFLASISLSFGSDTMYSVRSNYLVFILPTTFILFQHLKDKRYLLIYTLIISIYFLNYLTLPYRTNWAQIKYCEQNIPLKSIGIDQNIKLDINKINELVLLQKFNVSNQNVILSSMFSWGYCYLLNCKPISYNFNLYEDSALEQLNKYKDEHLLILIEEKDSPHFNQSFIDKVFINFHAKKIIKKESNIHNLYLLSKD